MKINNIEKLESYFKDIPEGHIINVIVIQRKKDNPDLYKAEVLIKEYNIRNYEHFLERKNEIIKLADIFAARVYVKLSPVSLRLVTAKILERVGTMFIKDNFNKITSGVRSLISAERGCKKIFIVDVDTLDTKIHIKVNNLIEDCYKERGQQLINKLDQIKTPNGCHLICSPFDRTLFKEKINNTFPDRDFEIDVFDSSLTLLYYNDEHK